MGVIWEYLPAMNAERTGKKTHRLQVWIDDKLWKAIKDAADRMGLDVSNWSRLALREKIRKDKE